MARPKINGSVQPIRTKFSVRYDPSKGFSTTQEYESAGDNLGGLALEARNAGMDYTLDANERKSRLVMTTTGAAPGIAEQATATWQLYTNEIQRDLLEHPTAVALGPAVVARIANDIKEVTDGKTAYATVIADEFYDNDTHASLIDLMVHGVTSYNMAGYTARATISLPFLFSGAVPGVSPDSLIAGLIGDIPVDGPDDGTLFNWGWRRVGTSRTFSGNTRTEINIEWHLASWHFLYSGVTALPA